MNKEGIFTADIACELITQKIKQYQLDYDIQETPASVVIVIRKRFIEDKKESIKESPDDKHNLKMLDYEKDVTKHKASNTAKPSEICSIRKMTKLHEELSNQQKENSNMQNYMKRCQTEMIARLICYYVTAN